MPTINNNIICRKATLLFAIAICCITATKAQEQRFYLGFSGQCARFTPHLDAIITRPILPVALEIQAGWRFTERWALSSGINYQWLSVKKDYSSTESADYPLLHLLNTRDLSVPLLLTYKVLGNGKPVSLNVTSGIYFVYPFYSRLSIISMKEVGGETYYGQSYSNHLLDKHCQAYLGCNLSKTITPKHEIYAGIFGYYQLQEANPIPQTGDGIFRERHWFGIKIGMNYSLKNKTHERE